MDDPSLFHEWKQSQFAVKLSKPQRPVNMKDIVPSGSSSSVPSPHAPSKSSLPKPELPPSKKRVNVATNDLLASRDLLTLLWYMDDAQVPEFVPPLNRLPRYFVKRGLVKPLSSALADMPSSELCLEGHDRLLNMVNAIRTKLSLPMSERLPKGGPPGLILFLLKSKSQLPPGPYRTFCERVITHFDTQPSLAAMQPLSELPKPHSPKGAEQAHEAEKVLRFCTPVDEEICRVLEGFDCAVISPFKPDTPCRVIVPCITSPLESAIGSFPVKLEQGTAPRFTLEAPVQGSVLNVDSVLGVDDIDLRESAGTVGGYLSCRNQYGQTEEFLISAAHVVKDFPDDLRQRLTYCRDEDVAAVSLGYGEPGFNLVSGAVAAQHIARDPYAANETLKIIYTHPVGDLEFKLMPDDIVFKLGRTTGLTFGRLVGLRKVKTERREYGEVLCVRSEEGQSFTMSGDSGAIYFTIDRSRIRPVALAVHLARVEMNNERISLGRPFPAALSALNFGPFPEFLGRGQIVRVVSIPAPEV